MHTQGPHSEVKVGDGGEKEVREKGSQTWDLPLLWLESGVSRVSWVHSSLTNLKLKSGNLGTRRDKWVHLNGQLSRFPRAF